MIRDSRLPIKKSGVMGPQMPQTLAGGQLNDALRRSIWIAIKRSGDNEKEK